MAVIYLIAAAALALGLGYWLIFGENK